MDEGHVVFDRDKLNAALRSGVKLNDCDSETINSLKLNPENINDFASKRSEELYEEQLEKDSAYDLSALGAEREIGGMGFHCTIGNIVLLNVIDSPLVSGNLEGSISLEDVAKALYVLYLGEEALQPIMNIREKIQDLYLLKPMCENNPAMCDRVMNKYDEIEMSRDVFAKDALDFYTKNFTGKNLQDVFDKLFQVIDDVLKGFDEVNKSGEDSKKKAS